VSVKCVIEARTFAFLFFKNQDTDYPSPNLIGLVFIVRPTLTENFVNMHS